MIESLFDLGRHLPIVLFVLGWTTPRDWLRLRRARKPFLQLLCDESLQTVIRGFYPFLNIAACSCKAPSPFFRLDDWLASPDLAVQDNCCAASVSEMEICEHLFISILNGLDCNKATSPTGLSPLMRASEDGHLRVCQLLLERRANANYVSVGGVTALALAIGPSCSRCLLMSRRNLCTCPRVSLTKLLLEHTNVGLEEALAATVRIALQDLSYFELLPMFFNMKDVSINCQLSGPDARLGTPLSVALERRVCPIEAPLRYRSQVVKLLLELRSDPNRPGPYRAWYDISSASFSGATPGPDLLTFAKNNSCHCSIIEILMAAQTRC